MESDHKALKGRVEQFPLCLLGFSVSFEVKTWISIFRFVFIEYIPRKKSTWMPKASLQKFPVFLQLSPVSKQTT